MKIHKVLLIVDWALRGWIAIYILYIIKILYGVASGDYVLSKSESVVFIIGTLLFFSEAYIVKFIGFLVKSKKRRGEGKVFTGANSE